MRRRSGRSSRPAPGRPVQSSAALRRRRGAPAIPRTEGRQRYGDDDARRGADAAWVLVLQKTAVTDAGCLPRRVRSRATAIPAQKRSKSESLRASVKGCEPYGINDLSRCGGVKGRESAGQLSSKY